MKSVTKDIDDILSLEDKRKLLKEIGQEDLLDMFKDDYKVKYKPAVQKSTPLDQQVSFSISKEEKEKLSQNLFEIRKVGPGISISAYVRNQVVSDIDMKEWASIAYKELKRLNTDDYDKKELDKRKLKLLKELEDANDKEDVYVINKKLNSVKDRISELKRQSFKRKYKLTGRLTFDEAQTVRWRAARLNISIADYLRYQMFDYMPGTDADLGMTFVDRKRFYISILDVYRNGWGEPEKKEECPNCQRYLKEITDLRNEIKRYRQYLGGQLDEK